MARPSKKNIEYFPHYVTHGKTMFVLETNYGNDGYAFWFKLLEILGNADGLFYDCNIKANWVFLIAKTKVTEETANNILNSLAELEAIDTELWTSRIIWSDNLAANVDDAFKRRITAKPKKPSLCMQKPFENDDSDNINGERKEKEKEKEKEKVKESKEKEEESKLSISSGAVVISSFESNIHPPSPIEAEKLFDWLTDMEPEVVIGAIEEAVNYNKRSMGYINAVLNNWLKTGITTLAKLDAYKRDRVDEKNTNQPKKSKSSGGENKRQYDVDKLEEELLAKSRSEVIGDG